jgi:hypothetical protein
MDAIQAAHDELFYATFPDARPSRCSARAEQEHAQMFGLGLLPVLCPPGEYNGGMVLVLSYGAETYAYADPDVYGYSAATAYMEPTKPSPYAAIAADVYAYAHPPPPPPPPPRLITDVWSLAHAVTPSVSPVQPPPLSSVSSVSTSSSSSKRRYSVFASEFPPEPTSATTRDPRRRRSEHATASARSSRERSSESEPASITTTTKRAEQESKGGEWPKKPPLACLFCRGRKIACGPPVGCSVESVGSCK